MSDHRRDWTALICAGYLVERSIGNVPDGKVTTFEPCGQNIIWEHTKVSYLGLELFLVNWRKSVLLSVNDPSFDEAVFSRRKEYILPLKLAKLQRIYRCLMCRL